MLFEKTATGATIEEAIAAAKAELAAPFDVDVRYDIIQMPVKKTLGLFGGKDAEVRVYYELPDKVPAEKSEPAPAPEVKAPAAPAPAEKTEEPKAEPAKPAPREKKQRSGKPAAPAAEAPKPQPVDGAAYESVIAYLNGILDNMDIGEYRIETLKYEQNNEIILSVTADEDAHAFLIGKHGDTLDNLQYLVRLFANKHFDKDTRFSIDIGGYRENKEAKLRAVAAKQAAIVRKTGRQIRLEPMNPYERRIIHTTVQDIEGVTSFSVGKDKGRRVIISLEEGVEPERGGRYHGGNRGGYNRGGKGSYNRNGGGYNRNYSDSTKNQNRPPRYDNVGTRYGKITPKKTEE